MDLVPDELLLQLAQPSISFDRTQGAFSEACDARIKHVPGEQFQLGLALKQRLDQLETRPASLDYTEYLALLLNCEYQLYLLNASTPLRLNPFLSHWVEYTLKWRTTAQQSWTDIPPRLENVQSMGWEAAQWTRLYFVMSMLDDIDTFRESLVGKTPLTFVESLRNEDAAKFFDSFDLSPFISVLESTEIWDQPTSPPLPPTKSDAPASKDGGESSLGNIVNALKSDPVYAVYTITHSPLDIASLELINGLFTEYASLLDELGIDPDDIARDFLNFQLRKLEKAPATLPPDEAFPLPDEPGPSTQFEQPMDRETLVRSVKLLVLFVQNLVRKDLVKLWSILQEIQEICVRYIWIKDVREFKDFLEGPAVEDVAEGHGKGKVTDG
ncbi:hypothetical protein K402DRAFT_466257 [Aulographum hederae CBS 113979]|uniref:Uncharacterized protein n=1 Tax=Aulographum hederae CBS 113979 TaxID=1176131 RepID=A0A6G1GR70_9PEZI|nr:hypothetical protein K402DRAFT_466257 [Aulographum hederae CBS 113979]